MAGDRAKALSLLANVNKMILDLEDTYGSQHLVARNRARTAADTENVGNYVIQDLRSAYAKLLIRVTACQDSA